MTTGWIIEQACPQCGGQVEFDEADRILSCKFCRVRHYLMPRDRFRYALPVAEGVPPVGDGEEGVGPAGELEGVADGVDEGDTDGRAVGLGVGVRVGEGGTTVVSGVSGGVGGRGDG